MNNGHKEAVIEHLNLTRAPLMAFLSALTPVQWETAVQSEDAEWTVADIVRHLANAEKGMTGLIKQFKVGKDPVPPDFDRERYNKRSVEKTKDESPEALLSSMKQNREHLLAVIDSLTADDWQKKGRHASLRMMTIEEVCRLIADHEVAHLQDMQESLESS